MRISNQLLDLVFSQTRWEYNGTHCPDNNNPLEGRACYYRAYDKDDNYISKITFSTIGLMEPDERTREIHLKAELRLRIEAITESFTTDHYGRICIEYNDPYSIRRILVPFLDKYFDMLIRGEQ